MLVQTTSLRSSPRLPAHLVATQVQRKVRIGCVSRAAASRRAPVSVSGGQVRGAHARAARIRTHAVASNSNGGGIATNSEQSSVSQETEAIVTENGFYPEYTEGYAAGTAFPEMTTQWGLTPRMAEQLRAVAKESFYDPEFTLFYTKHTKFLAKKIAAESNNVKLGSIKWKTFADGFPDVYVENAEDLRNKHVAFLASFHNPQVIFEQLAVIYALPRMFVASFTLVLPFFPTGTAERVEDEGDVATASSMARVLSCIPLSRGGPTSLVIYDIHALQERFYFGDNILPFFQSGIPLLKERLSRLPDKNLITIAYPDEGAYKRFNKMFCDFDQLVCTKVRDGDKRIVQLKEGSARGRHVVIVDDLVQSGGTLLECHKVLCDNDAMHVSAYVTHGVFPNSSYEKFFPEVDAGEGTSGFAHFWITDSCPQTVPHVENRAPFEVLSLATSVAACLHL